MAELERPLALEYRSDGPQCPHCGYVKQADEAHFYDEDWTDTECGSCGEPYHVHVHNLGFRWSTSKD